MHKSESTEVLYMPAHVTEVPCHSISSLRQSYNYMYLGTYYLITCHYVWRGTMHFLLSFILI